MLADAVVVVLGILAFGRLPVPRPIFMPFSAKSLFIVLLLQHFCCFGLGYVPFFGILGLRGDGGCIGWSGAFDFDFIGDLHEFWRRVQVDVRPKATDEQTQRAYCLGVDVECRDELHDTWLPNTQRQFV